MRKLSLLAIGFYVSILSAFSQNTSSADSAYRQRKLKLQEVNFVSSYYHQTGNNSAVTGGIGTEKLTDFANDLELKFNRYDSKLRQHTLDLTLGIDHYTSASSDKVDPSTISSASAADTRIYPSASYTINNEQKGFAFGSNLSFSSEYDYTSFGAGINLTKTSKNKNTEFNAKLNAFFDTWKVILPVELRPISGGQREDNYPSTPRNSYNASLSLSQILNKRMQVAFLLDVAYQDGLLGTPFHRVYFADNSLHTELLPSTRFKVPVGTRLNIFATDRLIIRTYYRYYQDDWGVKAHTASIELPVKLNAFLAISPFYRFYTQSAADYFAAYKQHNAYENFYTSDYDLSKFNSHFVGLNLKITPEHGVFNIQKLNTLELRYGHYNRSNGLQSNIITLAAKFK